MFFFDIGIDNSWLLYVHCFFTLSSATFGFTKAMRCLLKILEKGKDKKFAYILTTVVDPPSTLPLIRLSTQETEFAKNSFTECGFIINFDKSVWQPQKELIWLGIIYKQFSTYSRQKFSGLS